MPKTEDNPLGPHFTYRLRAALDAIQPRFSQPRYLHPLGARPWRFAPAALAIGIAGILGLTAYAATGSANPAVWTERAKTVIEAPPSPTPESKPTPPQAAPPPAPPARQAPTAAPSERPESSSSPEPRESPEPSPSPEPSGDHSGSGGPGD